MIMLIVVAQVACTRRQASATPFATGSRGDRMWRSGSGTAVRGNLTALLVWPGTISATFVRVTWAALRVSSVLPGRHAVLAQGH